MIGRRRDGARQLRPKVKAGLNGRACWVCLGVTQPGSPRRSPGAAFASLRGGAWCAIGAPGRARRRPPGTLRRCAFTKAKSALASLPPAPPPSFNCVARRKAGFATAAAATACALAQSGMSAGGVLRAAGSGGCALVWWCAVAGVVGFSGSRSAAGGPALAAAVRLVVRSGRSVAVGCAPGADAAVRALLPSARVFRAAAFRRPGGSWASALASRSAALVSCVAAGGRGSALLVWLPGPCPAGLVPSAVASSCFRGLGSGSWASAAFAVGLRVPVLVFPGPAGRAGLPAWGSWASACGCCFGGCGSVWCGWLRLLVPAGR